MSLGAYVAHHDQPAQTIVEEIAQRSVIRNGIDGVGEEFDPITLCGDHSADEQVVRGTILDALIAAEGCQMRAGGGDGGAERKLDSVQLTMYMCVVLLT